MPHNPFNDYNANDKAEALRDQMGHTFSLHPLRTMSGFLLCLVPLVSLLLAWVFSGAIARKLDCSDLCATAILAFLHLALAISVHFSFKYRGEWVPLSGVAACVFGLTATMLWRVHIEIEEDGTGETQAWLFALLIFLLECLVPATLAGLHWFVDHKREQAEHDYTFYDQFAQNVVTSTDPLATWRHEIESRQACLRRGTSGMGLRSPSSREGARALSEISSDEQRLDMLLKWYPGPRTGTGTGASAVAALPTDSGDNGTDCQVQGKEATEPCAPAENSFNGVPYRS